MLYTHINLYIKSKTVTEKFCSLGSRNGCFSLYCKTINNSLCSFIQLPGMIKVSESNSVY